MNAISASRTRSTLTMVGPGARGIRPATAHAFCWFALLSSSLGCQTLRGPRELDSDDLADVGDYPVATSENPVVQVSAESTLSEKAKKNTNAMLNFVMLREQESVSRAKELYQQGDALFNQAAKQPRAESKRTFKEAAELFGRAVEAAPGTALEQDALYMQGESLFFADRLMQATDVYQKLQKEYPRNRHIDRVAARLFSITSYWINVAKVEDGNWFKLINLTDASRPRVDTDGHAIRVLDQIRYDDPTGRLADDATMAAAAEYIRQKRFEDADEFLTDLRETFADSEHLFLAHLMGIRTKLASYAGPAYSGLVLEEADQLVKQTRTRFPDKLSSGEYAEMVARAAAEIELHKAERLAYRANYREKRKEYRAAREYYHKILEQFPRTPQADTARQRLEEIETLPALPEQRLAWLTTIFRDTRNVPPLETASPGSDAPDGTPAESGPAREAPPKTMLR